MADGKLRNEPKGWTLVAIASMLWGSDLLLRPRVLATGMDSVAVVMFEHLALTALFIPVLVRSRATWLKMNVKEVLGLLFIAWGGSGLATVLLTMAYAAGEPVTATLIQKLQPAIAISLAGLVLRERPTPMFFAWFGVALVGAYLMSFGSASLGDPLTRHAVVPALLALGAAAIWGSCTVIGRWSLSRLDPGTVAGLRFTFALPMLIVWNLLRSGSTPSKFQVSPSAIVWLLAIVLLPDALGMALYYVGLRRTPASLASLAELAYPATAIMLALPTAIAFSFAKWLGVGLLIVSLYVIRRGAYVRAPVPETA